LSGFFREASVDVRNSQNGIHFAIASRAKRGILCVIAR